MLRRTRRPSLLGPKIGTENTASETRPIMSYNEWNSNRKREQTFGGTYTQSFGISFPGISILFYFHPGIYGSLFGNSIITEMSGNFPPKIAYILSGQKVILL